LIFLILTLGGRVDPATDVLAPEVVEVVEAVVPAFKLGAPVSRVGASGFRVGASGFRAGASGFRAGRSVTSMDSSALLSNSFSSVSVMLAIWSAI
jgi:hypothetical protein